MKKKKVVRKKEVTTIPTADTKVTNLGHGLKLIHNLIKVNPKCFKFKLNDRWYPFISYAESFTLSTGLFGGENIFFEGYREIFSSSVTEYASASGKIFKDKTITFKDLIAVLGFKLSTEQDLQEHETLISETIEVAKQYGKMLDSVSSVVVLARHFFGSMFVGQILGSVNNPKTVIIESELESHANVDFDLELPFIRLFSMDYKEYVFADIRDVVPHKFTASAKDKLVLPSDLKDVISSVFDSSEIFGDLFSGRHGGMVIMANGPSGVGKTLTAEVFANDTKRPLYVLEMGELGTKAVEVEKRLDLIFSRAARWNAILLFDEADIFLTKRTEVDLERNAIVGIFLRLLDRYHGALFLTTNRADVIDPAFASRITLFLDYPQLSQAARLEVWQNMLKSASMSVEGSLTKLSEQTLNGRQIRNLVRLLKVVYKNKIITEEAVISFVKYIPASFRENVQN